LATPATRGLRAVFLKRRTRRSGSRRGELQKSAVLGNRRHDDLLVVKGCDGQLVLLHVGGGSTKRRGPAEHCPHHDIHQTDLTQFIEFHSVILARILSIAVAAQNETLTL